MTPVRGEFFATDALRRYRDHPDGKIEETATALWRELSLRAMGVSAAAVAMSEMPAVPLKQHHFEWPANFFAAEIASRRKRHAPLLQNLVARKRSSVSRHYAQWNQLVVVRSVEQLMQGDDFTPPIISAGGTLQSFDGQADQQRLRTALTLGEIRP